MASISERIFEIADKKYLDQSKFAAAVGVTQSVVSAWKNGKSESYMKRLPQIAELLGTSVEYLITGEKKAPAGQEADGREKEYVQLFKKLTPEEQDLVIAQLQGVVDSRDK